MLTILIRLFAVYIILIGTMRIMGKRQIGEMQVSELVITILLSELAAQPIADSNIPLFYAIVPIGILLSIEVIISFAVTKITFLKPIFDGKPNILIKHGKLDADEMAKVRISLEELLSQLRVSGISDISKVDYAILEHNGQLSVIEKSPGGAGIAHAVIIDSKISNFDLKLIKKDEDWLKQRLQHHNAKLENILLFTVDDSGKENIIYR